MESPVVGTELDEFPTALNPNEDHVDARGVFVQNDTSGDEVVHLTRDASNRLVFTDADNVTPVTLSQAVSGALPPATEVGQFLYSYDGSTFEIVKPVVADDGFVVTDDDGHIVVAE